MIKKLGKNLQLHLDYPLKVVEIPDINDLVEGKNNLNILKNFSIEDIADESIIDTVNISKISSREDSFGHRWGRVNWQHSCRRDCF